MNRIEIACVASCLLATALPLSLSAQSPAGSPGADTLVVLGVQFGTQPLQLTPGQLAAMPQVKVTVVNAHTQATETYSGVPRIDLLAKVGAPTGSAVRGKVLSDYIVATGSDHYKAVLALAEAEPDFHPGTIIVADMVDGKPLDAKEGPFKLVVSEDKRPARSVHNLVKIELKPAE